MMLRPLSEHAPGPSRDQRRSRALQSAKLLRDCSLAGERTLPERRACRWLMRRQALHWRHPEQAEN